LAGSAGARYGGRRVIWYRVRDLEAGRAFYADTLGFSEVDGDPDGGWIRLRHGETTIDLTEGEPAEGGVAVIEVDDAKGEAERLRRLGIDVGVVLELHGHVRLLDVFDPDGNRVQLTEDL
jgi:catechol 2,3-dioxygenase-like lactoylglutathione lyase family enzyme